MTDARPRNCPTCESPQPHLHPAMQFEGEVQPCKDLWHQYQPDARRGWLKEELEEVHNEVAAWPPWKRGETMSRDARREPVTREEVAAIEKAYEGQYGESHAANAVMRLIWGYRALSDRLAASEKVVAEVKAERDRWYGGAQDRAIEINKLKQRLAEVERERDAWHNDASSHLQALCEKQAEANGLEQQLADAQATISRLEDRIDLQCDEFQRISALTENDEVKGLCARAVKDIRQHVPVIQQRDTAEQQVARLREAALWAMKKVKRLSTRAVDYKRADDFIQHEVALKGA